MAPTTFMTDRLMKAANCLLAHGEMIEVRYVGYGVWRDCILLGPGDQPQTVKLGIWCAEGEIREGRDRNGNPLPIRFIHCLVPEETLVRLEQVAREQTPSPERQRAAVFIASASTRRQRTRDGRFADCTHRAEPKGCR